MIVLAAVAAAPWVLCVLVARLARRSDRWLVPATAVMVLPLVTAVAAVSATMSAIAVGALLATGDSAWLIATGVVLLAVIAWRCAEVIRHLARVASGARAAAEFGRRADRTSRILVVDDDVPDAFAVASGGGAVVVTAGLVAELSEDEMRAVVLHERAHLRYRHHMAVQIGESAAQSIPLLRPAVAALRHATERHADECAACGDRRLAMTALARAALVCSGRIGATGSAELASTGGDVVRRVRALSGPPPAPQKRIVIGVVAALVVFVGVLTVALVDVAQDVVSPETGEVATTVFR